MACERQPNFEGEAGINFLSNKRTTHDKSTLSPCFYSVAGSAPERSVLL